MLALYQPELLTAANQPFARPELELSQNQSVLQLSGEMSFNFSEAALEALGNGLPLAVNTEVVIRPTGKWYWQKALQSRIFKLEIQYHALSQQYLVKGFGDTYPRAFLTQTAALVALGRIDGVSIIDMDSLDAREQYEISVRAVLDSESLPVPLRPLIYLSNEWSLRSDWKHLQWPVKS